MESDMFLGEFLRARREATTPDDVGLRHAGHRRTPGLRREEVATLAGVSLDYYTRLEQGRELNPSDQVLAALGRVLNLGVDARDYLYELAHPRLRLRGAVSRIERVNPNLLGLLRSWDHTPAFVIGRWLDVLAANLLAEALYEGMAHRSNCLRMIFCNPEARDFYMDWEKAAQAKVAQLRAAVGANPYDPVLPDLVEELSDGSEDFRRLWARHDVRVMSNDVKKLRHRHVGELILTTESLSVNGAPGQQIVIMAAEPGSPSQHALADLRRLATQRIDADTPA
jgi:transcriptional regulator with XRE-family HTH domain